MTIDGTVFEAEALEGVSHGFFTREGGVSDGVYRTLNCGYGSNDTRDKVAENRRRVACHLGAGHDDVVTVYQVHSADVVVVDRPFAASAAPKADALVTATRGLAIGALAADCTPVLFAAPEAGVVGAAHAGWRGAVAGVLEATVAAMEQIGAKRHEIRAAVGPAIRQPAYEVGPEFEAQFLAQSLENKKFFRRDTQQGRPHFDLPGYCLARLRASGIGHVENAGRCTYANESLLYSYRRKTHLDEPDYGRQISAIVLA
jgi:purine-nucleoside/S-methyl-5'-thioadenosine phosphorylase / adenosine deaminase